MSTETRADTAPPRPVGEGVARGSVLMASGSLVARVLGVLRATLIGWVFGLVTACLLYTSRCV